jgi:hypothetical protein
MTRQIECEMRERRKAIDTHETNTGSGTCVLGARPGSTFPRQGASGKTTARVTGFCPPHSHAFPDRLQGSARLYSKRNREAPGHGIEKADVDRHPFLRCSLAHQIETSQFMAKSRKRDRTGTPGKAALSLLLPSVSAAGAGANVEPTGAYSFLSGRRGDPAATMIESVQSCLKHALPIPGTCWLRADVGRRE